MMLIAALPLDQQREVRLLPAVLSLTTQILNRIRLLNPEIN